MIPGVDVREKLRPSAMMITTCPRSAQSTRELTHRIDIGLIRTRMFNPCHRFNGQAELPKYDLSAQGPWNSLNDLEGCIDAVLQFARTGNIPGFEPSLQFSQPGRIEICSAAHATYCANTEIL